MFVYVNMGTGLWSTVIMDSDSALLTQWLPSPAAFLTGSAFLSPYFTPSIRAPWARMDRPHASQLCFVSILDNLTLLLFPRVFEETLFHYMWGFGFNPRLRWRSEETTMNKDDSGNISSNNFKCRYKGFYQCEPISTSGHQLLVHPPPRS